MKYVLFIDTKKRPPLTSNENYVIVRSIDEAYEFLKIHYENLDRIEFGDLYDHNLDNYCLYERHVQKNGINPVDSSNYSSGVSWNICLE